MLWFFCGILILLVNQIFDIFYFIGHTYERNIEQKEERNFKGQIDQRDFEKLLDKINQMTVVENRTETNAIGLIQQVKKEYAIMDKVIQYLFCYKVNTDTEKSNTASDISFINEPYD